MYIFEDYEVLNMDITDNLIQLSRKRGKWEKTFKCQMNNLFYFHNWKGISPPAVKKMRIPSIIYSKITKFSTWSMLHGLSDRIIKNMANMRIDIQISDDFFHFQNWKGTSSPTVENMRITGILYRTTTHLNCPALKEFMRIGMGSSKC